MQFHIHDQKDANYEVKITGVDAISLYDIDAITQLYIIFIILILEFNDQVKQLHTHVGAHCGPNVTSLLWVTYRTIISIRL